MIKYANGETKSGHVKRIERSSDWYGEEWYTADNRITLTLEASNGQESEAAWTDIGSMTIRPGNASNADCSYEWTTFRGCTPARPATPVPLRSRPAVATPSSAATSGA